MKPAAITLLAVLFTLTFAFLIAITPPPIEAVESGADGVNISQETETTSLAVLSSAQKHRIATYSNDWDPMPSYGSGFNALDPAYKIAELTDSLFDPQDEYWGLPRDDKNTYELVDAYCSSCHSLSIVMQQRASRTRWKELLVWMEKKQDMAILPPEDEDLVLDYISTYFSDGK